MLLTLIQKEILHHILKCTVCSTPFDVSLACSAHPFY